MKRRKGCLIFFIDIYSLEATKGLNAAADRQEVHPAASATTAVGASAAASPLSGAAARGADGPPIKSEII